jgi:hypothetical protein
VSEKAFRRINERIYDRRRNSTNNDMTRSSSVTPPGSPLQVCQNNQAKRRNDRRVAPFGITGTNLATVRRWDRRTHAFRHLGCVPTAVVTVGAWALLRSCLGVWLRFLVSLPMQPTEEQLTALGNYRDIIDQHLPEIAEGIGVPSQTLKGWVEGKGGPTSVQAQKILDFLRDKVARGPEV